MTWLARSDGMEYARVRTLSSPESTCLKVENWVSRSSLAWLTGMLKESQSPAGVSDVAVKPFSDNHWFIAVTVSGLGATNAFT